MKKMMKQWSVLAFLGLTTAALAQEGRVGINTTAPKATLEVKSSTANANATTNEGIIAPKLTKARIAKITAPQEGTLVYALDTTYSGTNSKVAKITEKGYYFYNGTEWVKVRDTNIYTENGTLSTTRIVNLDNKALIFSGNNARIKVPNMQERPVSENVSGVVMSADGTLKKDTGWWRLGDGPIDESKLNKRSRFFTADGEFSNGAYVGRLYAFKTNYHETVDGYRKQADYIGWGKVIFNDYRDYVTPISFQAKRIDVVSITYNGMDGEDSMGGHGMYLLLKPNSYIFFDSTSTNEHFGPSPKESQFNKGIGFVYSGYSDTSSNRINNGNGLWIKINPRVIAIKY